MLTLMVRPEYQTSGEFKQYILASDARLSRALSVARPFLQDPHLELFGQSGIVRVAENAQLAATRFLNLQPGIRARMLDVRKLSSLEEILSGPGSRTIFIRHGVQKSDATSKEEMMQEAHNVHDPVTDDSLVEAIGTTLMLMYLAAVTKRKIRVRTSENVRSAQIAVIISEMSGAEFIVDKRLNCINYPDVLNEEQKTLLAKTGGTVPWEREGINTIAGPLTFETMTSDMKDLKEEVMQGENVLEVFITHAQQLNALGIEGRPDPLGFGVSANGEEPVVYTTGLYRTAA